jgi:hypothetical protein
VRWVMREFNLENAHDTSDDFEFGGTRLEVTYSSGKCDEGEKEVWDVPAGKAVKIEIRDDSEPGWGEFAFDLSKLMKEQMYSGDDESFIFHSKKNGFAVEVFEEKVVSVILFPHSESKTKVCKSKYAEEFITHKSWFGSKKLKERFICVLENKHADVKNLSLSHEKVSAVTSKQIEVITSAVDPENDVLTYSYYVTGGRIVGNGAKVFWDLTGVAPGTYSITAAVDDGAGLVGEKVTKSVVVE